MHVFKNEYLMHGPLCEGFPEEYLCHLIHFFVEDG